MKYQNLEPLVREPRMQFEHEAEELMTIEVPAEAGGGYLSPSKSTILDALYRAYNSGVMQSIYIVEGDSPPLLPGGEFERLRDQLYGITIVIQK